MRYHFSGIAGAGMNPLARLMRAWGHEVQGSDRSLDQGRNQDIAASLRDLGITLLPQDGSAIREGLERFVYSTAVEAETPEVVAAKRLGLDLVPRPALLAEVVNAAKPGVAVSGTSGKSTVTALIAWILAQSGVDHTLLGGAAMVGVGTSGGFVAGPAGGLVVAETCESDGTLPGYRPGIGCILNITRDHAELESLRRQFQAFADQAGRLVVNGDCAEAMRCLAASPHAGTAIVYAADAPANAAFEVIAPGPDRAFGVLRLDGRDLDLDCAQPGRHSVQNAAAAACVASLFGVDDARISAAIAAFPGISRRFEVIGTSDTGIRVVDDYAHNADKIRAAIQAAQAGCDRLVATFLPHGYGPARFLRDELKDLLPRVLRPQDRFAYGPIFYAGGTVAKDVGSGDLAADIGAHHAATKDDLVAWCCEQAHPGDTVLVMGARDPDLGGLARRIYALV